ncbi:MAG: hypothetical protein VX938_09815, partial [Myxococcota bacterium]|nr:hypothetical protein [Myxococcota bacterium]
IGLGWPYLAQVRINTGLNERLDLGLTWQSMAHHLNEFLVRGKWLIARSRAFAVGVQGEVGFGIGQEDRASITTHVHGLASILIREKAAVTARAGLAVSRDWADGVTAHSSVQIPVGLSVEVRLNKFWNLALLVEGEPITSGRDVFGLVHDPLDTFDFDRPNIRGTAGVSLLF